MFQSRVSARPRRGLLPVIAAFAGALLASGVADAQPSQSARLAQLTHTVDGAEALRAIKRAQYAYSQFQAFGLWNAAASQFAQNGEIVIGPAGTTVIRGREAVARYLRTTFGGGVEGRPAGGVQLEFDMSPVVNLSADGATAKGRWHTIAMRGRLGANADWDGAIQENDYVKEGGAWKIARLHIYPQWAGPYETGWHNAEDDLKIVPFHYRPDQVGELVPAGSSAHPAALPALERRLQALADEDEVRNLQFAYGYYVDRKMWDDVADLFAADGSRTIADLGTYVGPQSIRRGMEIDGPAGLTYGQLNDHIQFNTIIDVAADGRTATARGTELGMTSAGDGKAYWSGAVYENRYVKQSGVWRIQAMQIFPLMKTDYALGWGKSAIPVAQPPAALAPDRPTNLSMRGAGVIPAFSFANPATGRPVAYPAGSRVIAGATARRAPPAAPAVTGSIEQRLAAAEAKALGALAFDATENLSAAFGNYVDDFQWNDLGQVFAARGEREAPGIGTYITPERISRMQTMRYGPMRTPRTSIPIHLRTQAVVHPSPDGRSAKVRTRLLQFNSSLRGQGTVMSGMYEDEVVLENGRWKLAVVEIDHIMRTVSYTDGWAKVGDDVGPGSAPPAGRLFTDLPPDRPLVGEPFATFPKVGRMWFHYANPVSGRAPPMTTPKPVAERTLAAAPAPAR